MAAFTVLETHRHKVRVSIDETAMKFEGEKRVVEISKDDAALLAIEILIACTGLSRKELGAFLAEPGAKS